MRFLLAIVALLGAFDNETTTFVSAVSAEPKYNLIHCKSELWCFSSSTDDNGNAVTPVCESANKIIDPAQPNYHERGLLQINNYARLFVDQFEYEYEKTFDASCKVYEQNHPLWEARGATEEAHFLSVSSRDCTNNPSSHNTCADYCYASESESRVNNYKPFENCRAGTRKKEFEWHALKHGYEEHTGGKKIHTNAEARCGADWPCVDGGHCGAVFNPTRWMTGVGRAYGTPSNPNPNSYFKGARTYAFGGDSSLPENQPRYWEKYGDQSLLHRIPSGSHFDKCRLDRNCGTVPEFQSIVYQFMYAHYQYSWVDGTAFVYINGEPTPMNIKRVNRVDTQKKPSGDNGEGSNWAVFEYVGIDSYPTACMQYYFQIQTEDGKTIRLPEDDHYTFATTGCSCDLNSYYTDDQNTIWKNCRDEYTGTDSATVPATEFNIQASTPTEAPKKTPTSCLPKETIVNENFEDANTGWTQNIDNNAEPAPVHTVLTYGQILGKLTQNLYDDQIEPATLSKDFIVPNPTITDSINIKFTLFEFDKWGGGEDGKISINGYSVSLGSFTYSNKQESVYTIVEPINDGNDVIKLTRTSEIIPQKLEGNTLDEVHTVKVTIPKVVYENTNGAINLRLEFLFTYWEERHNVGIDDFSIIAKRTC